MNKIHNAGPNSHRMPLLLTKELALQWLDENLSDTAIEKIIHYEFPASEMEYWPVNTIRTRKPDDKSVIEESKENYPLLR
jgi:putative SOS response-associated peptidase YedK